MHQQNHMSVEWLDDFIIIFGNICNRSPLNTNPVQPGEDTTGGAQNKDDLVASEILANVWLWLPQEAFMSWKELWTASINWFHKRLKRKNQMEWNAVVVQHTSF